MDPVSPQQRDLVLSPTQYAYVQDRTSGNVRIWTGPKGDTLTQNDRLVLWTGTKFIDQADPNQARMMNKTATENEYVVLTDPAAGGVDFPKPGETHLAVPLDVGKRIVIRGPVSFPLWPGQSARVIPGHTLNLNQYLTAQVYEPKSAKEFADEEVAEPQPDAQGKASATKKREYKMGERIVIRGDERSFYIPQTGIEVLPLPGKPNEYVQEAVTLEQLETCTLVDENGNKRYERGPKVVFPHPTESFVEERGNRKFRAIEVAPWQGLHGKVLAPYEDDFGEPHDPGEELFLTGGDDEFGPPVPIFYPRAELAIIERGNQKKHYATPVPLGEGRYLLYIPTGEVRLVRGPKMLLPDPRSQALVLRALDPDVVEAMYPGNAEAAAVNDQRRKQLASIQGRFLETPTASMGQAGALAQSYATNASYSGEKLRRGPQEFRPQPSVTLDTKFEGAVSVEPWPGFAILIRDKEGGRRVVRGSDENPHVNLEYHEDVQILSFSTGRPKSADRKLRTPYLQIKNNAVADRVALETKDLVTAVLEISLRVNFEADTPEEAERWFDVDDYVALLTLHVRSRLRNLAKRHGIQKFNDEHIDLIRDELLGESKDSKRPGRHFPENNMRLYDVEVLAFTITAPDVAALLAQASNNALRGAIQLSAEEQDTERHARFQELERERLAEVERTSEAKSLAAIQEIERDLERSLRAIAGSLEEAQENAKATALERLQDRAHEEQEIQLLEARNVVVLSRTTREVELFVQQVNAIDPKLAEAIRVYGQEKMAGEIAVAIGGYATVAGGSGVEMLRRQFSGTNIGPVFEALASSAGSNGHGREE